MFRDESSHVIKKAKAKARKKGVIFVDSDSSPEAADFPLSLATAGTRGRSLSLITPNSHGRSPDLSMEQIKWEPDDDDDNLLPSPDSGSWPETPMIAQSYNLNPTSQERGTAYFFSRYVNLDENTCHQKFDFVSEVWKPETLIPERQVDGVLASMTAVGLMGLANLTKSTEMMEAARKSYCAALRLINHALESPTEAVKDTTMLSVLVLGLFEMQIENATRTVRAFHGHVNGATAIAKMRGTDQFKTRAGIRMFLMLCSRVVISCVQQELPMPEALVNLQKELVNHVDARDPSMQLYSPIQNLLQMRCDMLSGEIKDPEIVIEKLLAAEDEFAQIRSNMPLSWKYRSLRVETLAAQTLSPVRAHAQHPATFRSQCHAYPSIWHAGQWNCIRIIRLLVLETILNEIYRDLRSPSPRLASRRYIDEFVRAKRALERILEAITASVPQNLGLVSPRDNDANAYANDDNRSSSNGDGPTPASTPISSVEVRETPSPSPAASPSSKLSESRKGSITSPGEDQTGALRDQDAPALTLLNPTRATDADDKARRFMLLASSLHPIVWPLFMVGMSSATSEAMKIYAVERLRAVAVEFSIEQAEELAALIEQQEVNNEWLHVPLPVPREDFMGTGREIPLAMMMREDYDSLPI